MQRLSFPKQRSFLPWAVGLAGLLALAVPAGWQRWANAAGGLVEVLASPVAGPLARFHRWLSPVPAMPADTRLAQVEQDNLDLRTRVYALVDENQRLRTLLQQARVRTDAAAGIDQLAVGVTGTGADAGSPVLFVRAGTRQGLDVGNVATVQFAHLLGRIIGVRPRAATVLPITAPASGSLDAVVLSAGVAGGLRAQLKPVGDGTLVGDVEDRLDAATQQPYQPVPGDEVRLADVARWPMHAQMLLVGKVERVEPSPRQPLRKTVVVRPVLGDLLRVSEIVVQIPDRSAGDALAREQEDAGSGAPGGPR